MKKIYATLSSPDAKGSVVSNENKYRYTYRLFAMSEVGWSCTEILKYVHVVSSTQTVYPHKTANT